MKYTVLNFSRLVPGPYILQQLLPDTVEVITIEDSRDTDRHDVVMPQYPDEYSYAQHIAKHQQVIAVDYRNPADMEQITSLVAQSAILIEHMRPGRMEKLRLGYGACKHINPHIVYCSLSNFGPDHPLSRIAMRDLNVMGYSGLLTLHNDIHLPHIPLGDIITSYAMALRILTALLEGTGAHIQLSLFEAMKEALAPVGIPMEHVARVFSQDEMIYGGRYPCYTLYQTQDDLYMALAATERSVWTAFCDALHISHIGNNQFDTSDNIRAIIATVVKQKTQKEWSEMALDCFTPVVSYLDSLPLMHAKL